MPRGVFWRGRQKPLMCNRALNVAAILFDLVYGSTDKGTTANTGWASGEQPVGILDFTIHLPTAFFPHRVALCSSEKG